MTVFRTNCCLQSAPASAALLLLPLPLLDQLMVMI
jgi:hypothetical protein